jgi:V8-like Glu-specific endopeptidase
MEVIPPQIYDHPHNCIGWIVINRSGRPFTNGSGFLIGPSLVLTSAHKFDRKPSLEQISFNLAERDQINPKPLKICSLKVSPESASVRNKIFDLKDSLCL